MGEEEDLLGHDRRRPWYAFWRKRGTGSSLSEFETPSDWLNTNVRSGLDSLEVERRRKFSGWNELVTEKENMLLKFISFFQGPILYGLPLSRDPHVCLKSPGEDSNYLQSWKRLQRSLLVFVIGLMLVSPNI